MDTVNVLIISAGVLSLGFAVAQMFHANSLLDKLSEHRAVIGFARQQANPFVSARFMRGWSEGNLDQTDPDLFREWMDYRTYFFGSYGVDA